MMAAKRIMLRLRNCFFEECAASISLDFFLFYQKKKKKDISLQARAMCVYELCHSNVCVCALGVSGFEQLLPFLLKLWGEMMKL